MRAVRKISPYTDTRDHVMMSSISVEFSRVFTTISSVMSEGTLCHIRVAEVFGFIIETILLYNVITAHNLRQMVGRPGLPTHGVWIRLTNTRCVDQAY